uniref:Thyroid receptor-interacting protein 11 n=1 Tax=Hydra vulgaris TaxID=6087 RepID=T2MDB5_HYDVU
MSWLNISGSLSSISNNISTFTREVLTEATADMYKDSDTEDDVEESNSEHMLSGVEVLANDTVDLITNELDHLKLEISSKDEQIRFLEQENNKLQINFEKHVTKLQQHIHDKDEEVEILSEKLKNLEADFVGKIEDLTFERDSLNAKLDAKDNDWGNNWSNEGTNDEELENLKLENESYSNELMMKEIVLNSIETRMREISKRDIDAADFSVWLDEYLQSNKESIILKWLNSTLNDEKLYFELSTLEKTEQWLSHCLEAKNKYDATISDLEKKNFDLQSTIDKIANTVTDHFGLSFNTKDHAGNSQNNFAIQGFEEWIKSLKINQQEMNENKAFLNQIQAEIREFDVEDESFNIKDFSKWIEKVQVRIDDLEVELLNVQDIKEKNEKQRCIERAKLEELFIEKQNEIALLKVELYNKSNFVESSYNETEIKDDLNALHEQLNEVHARCDAFKNELTCCRVENDKLLETDKENKLLIEDLKHTNITLEARVNELLNEIEKYHSENLAFKNVNGGLQVQVDELMSKCALLTQKPVGENPAKVDCCIRCDQNETAAKVADEKFSKLKIRYAKLIRQKEKLEKDYSHMTNNSQELIDLKKKLENQYLYLTQINNLLNDNEINYDLVENVLKMDNNDDNRLFAEIIRKILAALLLLRKKYNDFNSFAENNLLRTKKEELITEENSLQDLLTPLEQTSDWQSNFNVQIDVNNAVIENKIESTGYIAELEDKVEVLQKINDLNDLEGNKRINSEQISHSYEQEILNTSLESQFYQQKCIQLEKEVSELRIKINSLVKKDEMQLALHEYGINSKIQCELSEDVLQEKVHQLSLMLTEKSEECHTLKSKLLFLENETSDMDLIKEECKQLKAMLLGKENQTNIDDTLLLLQDECQQLKHLLAINDAEKRKLLQLNLEKDNEISDMQLLREECTQLKRMLVNSCESSQANSELDNLKMILQDKDLEIQRQSAIIIDLQNMSSNMEFVQEECKQLKKMLLDSSIKHTGDFQNNSLINEESNSFMVQVQELEEFLREKEHEILEKNSELQNQYKVIENLKDSVSNMELIQQENKSLKKMLSDKEELFAELQNDIDGANLMLQLKNDDIRQREKQFKDGEVLLNKTIHSLQSKEQEYELLKQELNESILQNENIQLLQTEYKDVFDKLNATKNELNETRRKLSDVEVDLQQMKDYKEKCFELSENLKIKNEELQHIKAQLSEAVISERETITHFQNELIELKMMILDKEMQLTSLNEVLLTKNEKLESIHKKYDEASSLINDLTIKNESKEEIILKLKTDFSNFNKEYLEKIKNLETSEKKLQEEYSFLKAKLTEQDLVEKNAIVSESNNVFIDDKFCSKCAELNLQLTNIHKAVIKLKFMQHEDIEIIENNRHLEKLSDSIITDENTEKGNIYSEIISHFQYALAVHEKTVNTINKLLSKLKDSDDNFEKLKMSYELKYADMESQILEYKELESIYENAYSEKESLQKNYKNKCIEYKELEELYNLKSVECKGMETKIATHYSELQVLQNQYEEKCTECMLLSEKLDTQKKEYLVEIDCIKKSLCESLDNSSKEIDILKNEVSKLSQKNETHFDTTQDEISLLQTQHIEKLSEMENLFKREMENVLNKHFLEKEEIVRNYQQQVQSLHLLVQNANECSDCINLKKKLAQITDIIDEKNCECEKLKFDILKLEEKLTELEQNNNNMQGFNKIEFDNMKNDLEIKNEKIKQLTLALEDNEARIEIRNKERIILEDFALQKAELENEKKIWVIEKQQLTKQIQELEVLMKHKEVRHKENEVKITRELERLRNHLIMTEDNHTKDILELHEKEAALQKELEEAKDALKKKNIILSDSSKQFQEHVFSIEEQLHHVSSQRDLNLLDLSKYKQQSEHDKAAIFNLQRALEQLEKEKREQYDNLVSLTKRKQDELELRIKNLLEEQQISKRKIEDASLAVQGISKLNIELNHKEQELVNKQNKINELTLALEQRNSQYKSIQVASDGKIDKFLIANLLLRYFQSPNDKRSDILQVVGGLLGWTHHDIKHIGDGSAPNKGWIPSVWGFSTPKKASVSKNQFNNMNQSFSELFVKFLETETDDKPKMNAASLLNGNLVGPNVVMLSPTPDILTFHNNHNETSQQTRIPAPGQEIPRVHTHHAQNALKTILS